MPETIVSASAPVDASATQVVLHQADLNDAAHAGLITPQQAMLLWARWSTAGGALAVASVQEVSMAGPRFSFTNTLYYFGGMVAIGAMTLFMTLGWQSFGAWGLAAISGAYLLACLKVADHLKTRSLAVPAGILATLAVCLVPLLVWSVQQGLGLRQ